MPFPTGWPPRFPSGVRSLRFFVAATATASYADRAYLFADQAGANPYSPLPVVRPGEDVSAPDYAGPHVVPATPAGTGQHGDDPHPMVWSEGIQVINYGATPIQFSFNGTNDHGEVPAGSQITMTRHEAGIAIKGAGNNFAVYSW